MSHAARVTLFLLVVTAASALDCNTSLTGIPDALRGRSLRVFFLPEPTKSVMIFPQSDKPNGVTGVIPDLYAMIQEKAGFSLTVINAISDAAMAEERASTSSPSSFTACVRDVRMGNLDLCIGDFWETPIRRNISTFVTPYRVDSFMIQSIPVVQSPDLWSTAFLPFKGRLWAVLVASMVFTGFLLPIVDRPHYKKPTHPFILMRKGKKPKVYTPLQKVGRFFKYQWHSMERSMFGFFSAAPAHEPRSVAGKLLLLGYGFFILVTIASYTANLAAFLTNQNTAAPVESITQASTESALLCIHAITEDPIKQLYPQVRIWKPDPMSSESIYSNMMRPDVKTESSDECPACDCNAATAAADAATEQCAGALYTVAGLASEQRDGLECSTKNLGEPVLALMNSQPVAQEVGPTISYWMASLRAEGVVDSLVKEYESSACKVESSGDGEVLDLEHFASTLIIFSLVCGLSMVVAVFENIIRARLYKERILRKQAKFEANGSPMKMKKDKHKLESSPQAMEPAAGSASDPSGALYGDIQMVQRTNVQIQGSISQIASAVQTLSSQMADLQAEMRVLKESRANGFAAHPSDHPPAAPMAAALHPAQPLPPATEEAEIGLFNTLGTGFAKINPFT